MENLKSLLNALKQMNENARVKILLIGDYEGMIMAPARISHNYKVTNYSATGYFPVSQLIREVNNCIEDNKQLTLEIYKDDDNNQILLGSDIFRSYIIPYDRNSIILINIELYKSFTKKYEFLFHIKEPLFVPMDKKLSRNTIPGGENAIYENNSYIAIPKDDDLESQFIDSCNDRIAHIIDKKKLR